jgi:hypothetical protein
VKYLALTARGDHGTATRVRFLERPSQVPDTVPTVSIRERKSSEVVQAKRRPVPVRMNI